MLVDITFVSYKNFEVILIFKIFSLILKEKKIILLPRNIRYVLSYAILIM